MSRSTLCPEVTVHGLFIKPSRKSSLCLGYPHFLRSPQPETVPIRRYLFCCHLILSTPTHQITSANHDIIHTSDLLQHAIPDEPVISFRCPLSPRNLLVRAKVPPTNDSSIPPIQHVMFWYTSRCVTCQEHIFQSDSFKSHTTGAHHKIRVHITCTTSNIIYLISCRICGIQYIGETKNSLKKRVYGHRSTVKNP